MIYELLIELSGVPEDVFESSVRLQQAFAIGTVFLTCFCVWAFCNMFVALVRGWK